MNVGKPPIRPSEDIMMPWKGIFEGDLVVFPPSASRGINTTMFESIRFAGREYANLVHRDGESWHEVLVPLISSGYDRPEFPSIIVAMAEYRDLSLREMYERPFEVATTVLSGSESDDGGTMLNYAFANDVSSYEGYWSNPPIARRRRPPTTNDDDGGAWKFSLGDCVWLATVEESNGYGDPPSWAGKGEEEAQPADHDGRVEEEL
jgi:hypothetical protein